MGLYWQIESLFREIAGKAVKEYTKIIRVFGPRTDIETKVAMLLQGLILSSEKIKIRNIYTSTPD